MHAKNKNVREFKFFSLSLLVADKIRENRSTKQEWKNVFFFLEYAHQREGAGGENLLSELTVMIVKNTFNI